MTIHENYKTYIISRILHKSVKNSTGCILYQGNLQHPNGVVSITVGKARRSVTPHRAIWMANNYPGFDLPSEIMIRHKCGNPRCVNIDHMEEGSLSSTRRRIHDDEKVNAIRSATGKVKHIAEQFDVSIGYVSKIKNGKLKAA